MAAAAAATLTVTGAAATAKVDIAGTAVVSTAWLVSIGLAVTADRSSDISCPNWRRAAASIIHIVGGSTGAAGPGASNGATNAASTPVGAGTVCGSADIVSGATASSVAGVVTTWTGAG